jgi:hypothetical protein
MLALPGYLMFGWYVITALIVLFFTLLALVGILFGSAEWSDCYERVVWAPLRDEFRHHLWISGGGRS